MSASTTPGIESHMPEHSSQGAERGAMWPYASLFFLGVFGVKRPPERRLGRRMGIIWVVLIVAVVAVNTTGPPWNAFLATAIPGAVAASGWAFARYLGELDELSRTIQLRGLAFAYGCVMVLLFAWVAFVEVRGGVVPGTPAFLVWILLAEPLRGAALVWIARRYQ